MEASTKIGTQRATSPSPAPAPAPAPIRDEHEIRLSHLHYVNPLRCGAERAASKI